MRKGTKKIRKVFTGTQEYWVYDLDEDEFGKRKRLYAKTEGELKQKIEQAEKEKREKIARYKPKTSLLSDYVRYYFKNAVGNIPSREIKRLLKMFEKIVFGSEIDKDMNTITTKEMQDFYAALIEKYPYESVQEIDKILRKTYTLANQDGVSNFNYDEVTLPETELKGTSTSYILSPDEYENLFSFCLADNCTRYGRNELIIIFLMFTGLKVSVIKSLTAKDFDLEKGYVIVKGKPFKLSEQCVNWLRWQAANHIIPLQWDIETEEYGFTGNEAGKKKEMESTQPELSYNPDAPVFVNSNGVFPTLQSLQSTISAITRRCGLPKGVTSKTLYKSYIISELSKGVSVEELCERFGYKNRRYITDIQDEYEVQKILF